MSSNIAAILNQAALAKNLTNFEVKPDTTALVGDGFLSTFYQGDIIDKDTGETTKVAVKMAPVYDFECEAIFSNEILFYSKLLPELRKLGGFNNVAEYLTSNLDSSNRFIAIEHLQPKGYKMLDKTVCMDDAHLRKVFEVYAKLHGLTLALKHLNFEAYHNLKNGFKDISEEFVRNEYTQHSLVEGLGRSVKNLTADSDVRRVAAKLFDQPIPITRESFQYHGNYACIAHGDGWSNNMLFKYSENGDLEDVKLIDFQMARETTPVHDLSYFFYSSASKTDLDHLEQYLTLYHTTLTGILKSLGLNSTEIFPYQALVDDWKRHALLGVILSIFILQMKLLDKSKYAEYLTDDSLEMSEATVKFWQELMRQVYESDSYKTRTRDILTHAYEFGVLSEDKYVKKHTEVSI